MATDSMEPNFKEIHAIAEGEEGQANWFQECEEPGNLVQELDLGGLGGPKTVVSDQDHAPKKVKTFYFVKCWPYKAPEENSKIEQAEKFIQKMDQERIPILKSYTAKWSQLRHAGSQLSRLRRRQSNLDYAMNMKQYILDYLEEARDKLNSQNNSYKKCSSSSPDPNSHITRQLRLAHGNSTNLATERKLLKEISKTRSQLQAAADDFHHDSSYFMKRLNDLIQWFYKQRQCETRYKKFLKRFKHLEEKMEKKIATAFRVGRTWEPWTSRTTIQDHITFIKKLSDEMEKEEGEMIAEIERATMDKETQKIRKEAIMLGHQLSEIDRRKEEAQKCILNLRKRHEEANVSYNEYLQLMKRARELARKKDVAALEELSSREVDKFMYRWNDSKVFRNGYVKRVLPSLSNRQLRHDGMMKNPVFSSIEKSDRAD